MVKNFNILVLYDYYKRFSLESLSFSPSYINLKLNINIKLKSSLSFFLKSTKISICWFVDVLICCFVDLLIFVDFQQISTINKRFSETSQQKSTINKQKNFDFQPWRWVSWYKKVTTRSFGQIKFSFTHYRFYW